MSEAAASDEGVSDDDLPSPAAAEQVRVRRAWALPACLLVAIVLPVVMLAALVWVLPRPASGFAAAVHPVGTPVQTGTDTGLLSAVATLRWRGGPSAFAPSWSGLVTEVRVHAGDTVTTGSELAVIDGVTRIAVASGTPFYRGLSEGDAGADVTMLRRALTTLGFGDFGERHTFDTRLGLGVGKLSARLGGEATTTTFDPSWFVYLPASELTAGAVKIAGAQPAPQAGDEILTSRSTLTGVTIGPPSDDSGAGGSGGSGLGGTALARFPDTGVGYVFAPDSDASVTIPLDAGFAATGPLTKIATLAAPGDASLGGTIRRAQPRDVSMISTTALVTGARGRTCVYPYGPDATKLTPLPVDIVGGEPGLTKVEPIKLEQVLANPAELSGLPACP